MIDAFHQTGSVELKTSLKSIAGIMAGVTPTCVVPQRQRGDGLNQFVDSRLLPSARSRSRCTSSSVHPSPRLGSTSPLPSRIQQPKVRNSGDSAWFGIVASVAIHRPLETSAFAGRVLPVTETTHLYRRTPLMHNGKGYEVWSAKRAGHGLFRHSVRSDGHSGLLISGFGVRVPGGAHQPGSRRCPGLLHVSYYTFTTPFAAGADPDAQPAPIRSRTGDRSGACSDLPVIVTVHHITSLRIGAAFSDSSPSPALSRHQPPTLEA
jgi:hypothetical protein